MNGTRRPDTTRSGRRSCRRDGAGVPRVPVSLVSLGVAKVLHGVVYAALSAWLFFFCSLLGPPFVTGDPGLVHVVRRPCPGFYICAY